MLWKLLKGKNGSDVTKQQERTTSDSELFPSNSNRSKVHRFPRILRPVELFLLRPFRIQILLEVIRETHVLVVRLYQLVPVIAFDPIKVEEFTHLQASVE